MATAQHTADYMVALAGNLEAVSLCRAGARLAGSGWRVVHPPPPEAGVEQRSQREPRRGLVVVLDVPVPAGVDPAAAAAAARAYLAGSGHPGTVTVTGDRTIQVTVTVTEPAVFTAIIGISQVSATQTATANLFQGITGISGGFANSEGWPGVNPEG